MVGACANIALEDARSFVLEARNEALRLVDDQSVAVAGAAEAGLFGPHRHGARARVLWARAPALTFAQPRSGDRGRFGPAGLVANAPTHTNLIQRFLAVFFASSRILFASHCATRQVPLVARLYFNVAFTNL
jgi:hypothetical protein